MCEKEKVVIVGVYQDYYTDFESDMEELSLLAEAAGGMIVGQIVQRLAKFSPSHLMGKGKLDELLELCLVSDANTVIFDNELSATQIKNLSAALGDFIKVVDRSGVILDIFASRARTAEAKIQVNLAQLEYVLPRLSGLWKHLERQRGGIGLRGPGEKQIESDRRVINKRISVLKDKLTRLEKHRRNIRYKRRSMDRIALVGYTNAGKSTILNALTGAEAFAEDMLFATLDPKTRRMSSGLPFEPNKANSMLITDTVGFIKKLPHHLVESFKSTLGEAAEADILCIVADISDMHLEAHLETVNDVLKELDILEKKTIVVLNKIDKVSDIELQVFKRQFNEAVFISASKMIGIENLRARLFDM